VKQAIVFYQKALDLDPHYTASLYHIGLMYHAAVQFAKAVDAFTEVLR
jgi:predicted TPR repeat methyltransferase